MDTTKVATGQRTDRGRLHRRLPDQRHEFDGDTSRSAIGDVIAALASGAAIADVLTNLTAASVELVQGADCAKISVVADGQLCSTAATSEIAASLDAAQQVAHRGPCLEAISTRQVIRCDDLRTDLRWPQFSPRAWTAGVRSVMSCPIETPGADGATLSLFGFRPGAFGAESETVGEVLASHASIMLLNQRQERQFKAALGTRDVIGQAKGMIMERFGVDADDAFAMLKKLSQEMNSPVRILAVRFVNAGRRAHDDAQRASR